MNNHTDNSDKQTEEDKRAESFIIAMVFIGIVLYELLPSWVSSSQKGAVFLFCLAIGFMGAYYPERTRQLWNILIEWFRKLVNVIFSFFSANLKKDDK